MKKRTVLIVIASLLIGLAIGTVMGIFGLTSYQMRGDAALTTKGLPRSLDNYIAFDQIYKRAHPNVQTKRMYGQGGDDQFVIPTNHPNEFHLNGGMDFDTFIFVSSNYAKSVIVDFTPDEDKIDVSYFYWNWKQLSHNIVAVGNDTVIFLDDTNVVELRGVKKENLMPRDFVFDSEAMRWRMQPYGDIRPHY